MEVASIEINGKGTMLPPRLSLLESAIGLGNTDGFGWLEPGGGALGEALETDVTEEEQDTDGTARSAARSGDAGRE